MLLLLQLLLLFTFIFFTIYNWLAWLSFWLIDRLLFRSTCSTKWWLTLEIWLSWLNGRRNLFLLWCLASRNFSCWLWNIWPGWHFLLFLWTQRLFLCSILRAVVSQYAQSLFRIRWYFSMCKGGCYFIAILITKVFISLTRVKWQKV